MPADEARTLLADLEAWVCPMCNGKGSLPDIEIDGSKHRCRSCAPIVAALPAILTALRAGQELDAALSNGRSVINCRSELAAFRNALAALGEGPRDTTKIKNGSDLGLD